MDARDVACSSLNQSCEAFANVRMFNLEEGMFHQPRSPRSPIRSALPAHLRLLPNGDCRDRQSERHIGSHFSRRHPRYAA